jgi:para-nitrobenzyl esterase
MDSIVNISSGAVRGRVDGEVHAFRGIPYAASVGGANRFRPAQPVEPWDGVRDATAGGLIQPQPMMPPPFGGPLPPAGDDSLNLNVWTPDPTASGLPVLVWIHGGAFVSGSGIDPTYDGTSFARNGVVCVTINYRLGAQGFMHLADHFPEFADSGTLGSQDQVVALRWVQDNIAAFGGDPTRVTVAGESAGGMSVGALLAMPSAKGLFQQAVPQSGAGHNGVSAATASRIAGYMLEAVGVAAGDTQALLAVTSEQWLEAQVALTTELQTTRNAEKFGEVAGAAMPFQPTYGTAVLPQRPIDAIAAGAAADVAILVGTTMEESLVFVVAMAEMFNDVMVTMTMDAVFAGQGETALAQYRSTRPDAAPHEIVAAVETDRMFRVPAVRLADAQSAHNPNVWMYRFDWRTPTLGGIFGACHALELAYVFHTLDSDLAAAFNGPDAPRSLADAMHGAWVHFATHGAPGHSGLPEWPRYTATDRPTMSFDVQPGLLRQPNEAELALWDGVL